MARKILTKDALIDELEREVGRIPTEMRNRLKFALEKKPPYGAADLSKLTLLYEMVRGPRFELHGTWYRPSKSHVYIRSEVEYIGAAPGARIISYPLRDKSAALMNDLYHLGKEEDPGTDAFIVMNGRHGPLGAPFLYVYRIGVPLALQAHDDPGKLYAFFEPLERSYAPVEDYFAEYLSADYRHALSEKRYSPEWDPVGFFLHWQEAAHEIKAHAQKYAEVADYLLDGSGANKEQALEEIFFFLPYARPKPIMERDRLTVKWHANCPIAAAYIYLLENELEGKTLSICENKACGALFYDLDPRKKYCSDKCRVREGIERAKHAKGKGTGGTPAKRGRPPKKKDI